MKKIFLNIFLALSVNLLLINLKITSAFAQTFNFNIKQQKGQGVATAMSAESTVQIIIANVISLFFTIGGIGVVIYFVWGAVDWILSGGDKEKVANARKKMTNAIIGLVLLALSFMIIRVVGSIVGFNPLGNLQLKGLGDPNATTPNI